MSKAFWFTQVTWPLCPMKQIGISVENSLRTSLDSRGKSGMSSGPQPKNRAQGGLSDFWIEWIDCFFHLRFDVCVGMIVVPINLDKKISALNFLQSNNIVLKNASVPLTKTSQFVNVINTFSSGGSWVNRLIFILGCGKVLNRVLYGEAPPRGPTSYAFIYHFCGKMYPFRISSIHKTSHFTNLFLDILKLCIRFNCCNLPVNALS